MIKGGVLRQTQEVPVMQLKQILLPYDGSKHSANAAAYAVHLARNNGATVTIVHCYDPVAEMSEVPEGFIVQLATGMRKRADAHLNECAAILEEAGVTYEKLVKEGSPGKVITDLAKSKAYDMIIMGSVGHTDIAGLFLGSVTHKVISTMYCPVLIVP